MLLAIDEGTTGVRAMLFDADSIVQGSAYEELPVDFPRPGWVEQDPVAIWEATQRVINGALREAERQPGDVRAIGICCQRGTTVVWERASGRPLHPAICWQDGRTMDRVAELLGEGIIANPMASSTKLEWILRHGSGALARAENGALAFGTIDSWLAWNLSGGRAHATDHSNASCTGLYDYGGSGWDLGTAQHLGLDPSLFGAMGDSSAVHGETDPAVFGAVVPIAALAGDQQAAMFGELATERGAVKVTYGTGGMLDVHTGDELVLSEAGAYPLVLWSMDGERPYCLEGTVITAGAAVQWLRDGLGILEHLAESEQLAATVPDSGGVWAVPAFQGLGTPYLDLGGRAAIGGLSRGSTRAHVVRAVFEGIAFRTREALEALLRDTKSPAPAALRIDGGAAINDTLLQCVADATGLTVQRPATVQASALGTAYLAGLATGVWASLDEVRESWRAGPSFAPAWSADERDTRFAAWRAKAIAAARSAD